MRRVLVMIAIAGCGGRDRVDDCKVVRDTPARALEELGKRYKNPAKVAHVIERCVAPEGELCARIAKVVATIPALAPQLPNAGTIDVERVCKIAPPELQQCLLPSHVLAHQDECKQAMQRSLASIEIEPRAVDPVPCNGGSLAIYVDADGVWLATAKDTRCFAPRARGELDLAWLEERLQPYRDRDCQPAIEIAGAGGVSYQDIIDVMDTLLKLGLHGVGLASARELPVSFANVRDVPKDCPPTTIAMTIATEPDATARPPLPPAADNPLASAPVIVITRDEIRLDDVRLASIDELPTVLPKPAARALVILQADAATDMAVITRVVEMTKKAGYDDVMFAVKNR